MTQASKMTERTIRKRAGELLTHGEIAGRLAKVRSKAEGQGLYSLEQHMNELKALRELAKSRGQISAAVAAEVKRGELMGYYIERKESTNVNYTITNEPLSADEWTAKYCVGPAAGQKH